MQYIDDIVVLIVIYATVYGLGALVSKLWWWLRIIIFLVVFKGYFESFDFRVINYKVVLVLIVPALIFVYPSFKKMFSLSFGVPNPFRWMSDELRQRKYIKQRKQEVKAEEEALERLDRLTQIAERQRKIEREREEAERKAREQARQEAERKAQEEARRKAEQEAKRKNGQKEEPKPKANTKTNPYEILGVRESDSLEDIHRAYKELSKLYHPNMVNHLGKEFQEMAHEKFIRIEGAWNEIKRKRGANS